jgi:hypothetical protein
VILLGTALWRFWPSSSHTDTTVVPVELAPELSNWVHSANTVEIQPSRYEVELGLNPTFTQSLRGGTREAQLGYGFRGPSGTLFQGVAPCRFDAGKPTLKVSLPNPDRVSARGIHLYLAR